ncbi:MAG: prepilin-type N-terminal cleavage/methylation domain-containing protein [Lachnoclostridium sp.]|nr:prepilin-type N-terminal cleavage/methylation domain-containing protein [Lachnospira sp.]MCM1246801.1 prepilin-type N-terminal cleavage/methylation domain-containing protein [Lachnoclostridium sp.]MCM1535412.1 prepilin-type N-terminal cleavage/methylation domain-containing protein [Clostridium sp.]
MKKEMNNKGFSLVELIIVIAIMAVLVGVLAPQYLKYVNNSKVSTDITNAGTINTAFSAAIADGSITNSGTFSGTGGTSINFSQLGITNSTGLSMTMWPDSKVKPGAQWSVTLDLQTGVSKITLDTIEIFPNSDTYKTAKWK